MPIGKGYMVGKKGKRGLVEIERLMLIGGSQHSTPRKFHRLKCAVKLLIKTKKTKKIHPDPSWGPHSIAPPPHQPPSLITVLGGFRLRIPTKTCFMSSPHFGLSLFSRFRCHLTCVCVFCYRFQMHLLLVFRCFKIWIILHTDSYSFFDGYCQSTCNRHSCGPTSKPANTRTRKSQ